MLSIIIAGFEPFHTYQINPSLLVAQALNGRLLGNGVSVIGCQIPVVRTKSAQVLLSLVQKHNAKAVIALGQAGRKVFLLNELPSTLMIIELLIMVVIK